MITNDMNDDEDIQREIHNMFIRTTILFRKFSSCSLSVKKMLLKSYCLCLYDVALWSKYTIGCFNKFRSCYNKCIKLFFGYRRRDSVTSMLAEIGLPCFSTVMHNASMTFQRCVFQCSNHIVNTLRNCNLYLLLSLIHI